MSNYYLSIDSEHNVIAHHGVKGMKWGEHIFGDKQYQSKMKKYAAQQSHNSNETNTDKRLIKEHAIQRRKDKAIYKSYRKFMKNGGDSSSVSKNEQETILRGGRHKIATAAIVGTVLGTPLVGAVAAGVTAAGYNRTVQSFGHEGINSESVKRTAKKGKAAAQSILSSLSNPTIHTERGEG